MLGPKGAVVVDDVDANWGFRLFSQTIPGQVSLICEAEPLRPDLRRFNKKGLFGIFLKTPTAKVLPSSNLGPEHEAQSFFGRADHRNFEGA
jgi:hypothetical protein